MAHGAPGKSRRDLLVTAGEGVDEILGHLKEKNPSVVFELTRLDDDGLYMDAHCEWTTEGIECVISYTTLYSDVRVMTEGCVFEGVHKGDLLDLLRALPAAVIARRSSRFKHGALRISVGEGRQWIGSSNLY